MKKKDDSKRNEAKIFNWIHKIKRATDENRKRTIGRNTSFIRCYKTFGLRVFNETISRIFKGEKEK